jgi:large subunit ribosomal protein L35
MPSIKAKTHKGTKKRFKVSATGKVSHKRCGSSHLNSHKSGSQIRKLRKKSFIKVGAEARRLRHAIHTREKELGLSEATLLEVRLPNDEEIVVDEPAKA